VQPLDHNRDPRFALPALFPGPAIFIAAVGFAVIVPTLWLGIPSGHDFEFHLNSWMEVLQQWKLGILYPRWAALAHYGYGEARFIFYPPASWMLGALLGAVLPWAAAPDGYIWIVLTVSGCSMFVLARRWLQPTDALFAAGLYAANPYHLVIVYWRSAFAELLAGALLPLLLLYILRVEEEGRRALIPLSLVVAAAWLTNAPAAVMVNYSLALLALIVAVRGRSARVLVYAAAAVVIGAALAAFYVLPAAYEEKWVNISQVLSAGVRPQDNFLFTRIADPDHNRFNLLVSIVAFSEIVVIAAAAWLARSWRRRASGVWWIAVVWSGAAILLMFSITSFAWQYLPKLRFVQLPWRWLLCMNVGFALMVTIAWRRHLARLAIVLGLLAVIALVWNRLQPPWWDTAADIVDMQNAIQQQQGYEGTDEYVPAGADPYEINRDARRVTFEGEGTARIHVQQWEPERRFFTADVSSPGKLVLKLFNYPAWKVEVNGTAAATETKDVTGQLVIPVAAGLNRVRVRFVRTWDRTAGGWISALTLLLIIAAVIIDYKRHPIIQNETYSHRKF